MKAAIFAGQGAQRPGMGLGLLAESPTMVREADALLGCSIEQICRDSSGQLADTRFTQPALYVVQAAAYVRYHSDDYFDCFLGHSVGEYAALFASGMISFRDGLQLVAARGRIMAKYNGGAMLAFIGCERLELANLLCNIGADRELYIANENTPTQHVVAGPKKDIEFLQSEAEKVGLIARPLKVSGAFHSPHMRQASYEFYSEISKVRFREPTAPVISSCTGKPYVPGLPPAVLLSDQISSPVRWTDTVNAAVGIGVTEFIEIGHGKTLTNITREVLTNA